MDEMLKTAISQVPGLVVLVCMVRWMMTFIAKYTESRDAFIHNLHDEHLQARADSREAIRENAAVTRENTSAIRDLRECIRERRT